MARAKLLGMEWWRGFVQQSDFVLTDRRKRTSSRPWEELVISTLAALSPEEAPERIANALASQLTRLLAHGRR
jgi:hypothetical protein